MRRSILVAALLATPLLAGPALAQTDAATGQKLYTQKCAICHAPNQNKIGPMHKGIVGKKIASVPGYAYSAAIKKLPGNWTPAALDSWLANPQKVAPGSKMVLQVADANQRKAIIAYLATLK